MSKKRTKRYLKKLDKALQENNRYLAGIMDLVSWNKIEVNRVDDTVDCYRDAKRERMSLKEAKKRGLWK